MNAFFFRNKQARHEDLARSQQNSGGGAGAGVPDQSGLFQAVRQQAIQSGDELLRAVAAELQRGEHTLLEAVWREISFYADVVKVTDAGTRLAGERGAARAQEATGAWPDYVVSSWFLTDCWSYLMSDVKGDELLHVVTGVKVGLTRTLDRMLPVALESHSAVHARANQQELLKLLMQMSERWGQALYGLFHRHPGQGALMTRPSGTDWKTHARYEKGYPLIGAIFVKDGWVRFFAHHPFTITVSGKGVTQYEDHVFKIETPPRPVSYDTAESKHQG